MEKVIYKFKVSIQADRYPVDFMVEAGRWHTAIYRAVKAWEAGKGNFSHTKSLSVTCWKVGRGTQQGTRSKGTSALAPGKEAEGQ